VAVIVATLLVFTVGWIVVFSVRTEHQRTKLAVASPAERRWMPLTITVISLHVTAVQCMLTLVAAGVAAPALAGSTGELAFGMAIFLAGLAWWLWARHTLGPIAQFLDTVSPPSRLIVTGPFSVVRHPLALGTLLCALGPAVAASSPLTWATFAACVVCLGKRCQQDEEQLWQVFGPAYATYAAHTRHLVPFVW